MIKRQLAGQIIFKNKSIKVTHDKVYRYYIEVEGKETQKQLNGKECIQWLLNVMHTEECIE